jgi:uncharacterized ferritin-like protein (DUF455 family)
MEIKEFALRILTATSIDEKLLKCENLTDFNPGVATFINEPSRPLHLQFKTRKKKDKLPPFHEHCDKEKRAMCLHRFAGHELLAVEIMALALLLFPDAPKNFRKGLLHTLIEEQEHVAIYIKRLNEMGYNFGDFDLYKHFWNHVPYLHNPINYVSMMSLTFEMANLDFAPMYGKSFERNNDLESAKLMARIFLDELNHVNFGFRWLKNFKDKNLTDWQAFKEALPEKIDPKRAMGFVFHEDHRILAGISQDWIDEFKNCSLKKIPNKMFRAS